MKCMSCDSEMINGKVEITNTFWHFLSHGASNQNLYFENEETKFVLLDYYDTAFCWYCENCGNAILNRRELPASLPDENDSDEEAEPAESEDIAETTIITCRRCGSENPSYANSCVVCRSELSDDVDGA